MLKPEPFLFCRRVVLGNKRIVCTVQTFDDIQKKVLYPDVNANRNCFGDLCVTVIT